MKPSCVIARQSFASDGIGEEWASLHPYGPKANVGGGAGEHPNKLTTPASRHTGWYACATHVLQDGDDIGTIQELLGHRDVKTTMLYTHVLNREGWPLAAGG